MLQIGLLNKLPSVAGVGLTQLGVTLGASHRHDLWQACQGLWRFSRLSPVQLHGYPYFYSVLCVAEQEIDQPTGVRPYGSYTATDRTCNTVELDSNQGDSVRLELWSIASIVRGIPRKWRYSKQRGESVSITRQGLEKRRD